MTRALLLVMLVASPAMADDYIDKLIPALATATDAKAAIGTPPDGVKLTESGGRFTLTFAARDTKAALVAWKWKDVFAVSGDVHQTTFHIRRKTAQLDKRRIATRDPHAGRWTVRVKLALRPKGTLPELVAGASPAYELPRYASNIDTIEIELQDLTELEMNLGALTKPTWADVERELGPADGDIGSGIHIYEYKLAGKSLRVGTPDNKRVMYIKLDDRDLYRETP